MEEKGKGKLSNDVKNKKKKKKKKIFKK